MVRRCQYIVLLVLLTLVAGCTSGGVEGTQTESEGNALSITGPECSPVSTPGSGCSRISKYDNVKITMSVENTGSRPVTIPFKDLITPDMEDSEKAFRNIKGAVLRSQCPDFFSMTKSSLEIEKITTSGISTYRKPQNSAYADISEAFWDVTSGLLFFGVEDKVILEPGERLDYEWILRLRDPSEVSGGFQCSLNFKLQTDQQVSALRRIQLKESENIESLPGSSRSTPGPMKLNINAPDTWIVGQLENFPVTVYLENKGSGTPSDTVIFPEFGDSIFDEDLIDCTLQTDDEPNLAENEVRMLNKRDKTTEKKFTCEAGDLQNTDSETAILTLEAAYGYTYNVGSINIELCEGDSC